MFPVLFDLGTVRVPLLGTELHLALPSYGVLFATGALLAWWWFVRRGRSLGMDETHLFNVAFWGLVGGILGAKLALVVVDWRTYVASPAELLSIIRSAGVLAGGVIIGALSFAFYATRHGLPLWRLADAIAAPLALGQAIGRLGCFAGGCCWGRHAEHGSTFAVTFTDPRAAAQTGVPLDVALLPIQLVQMTHDLLLAGLLTWLWRRRPQPDGTVFWVYVLVYAIGRGTIEFWRGDVGRGVYFGGHVSTSQLVAAGAILLSTVMLTRGFARRRADAAA